MQRRTTPSSASSRKKREAFSIGRMSRRHIHNFIRARRVHRKETPSSQRLHGTATAFSTRCPDAFSSIAELVEARQAVASRGLREEVLSPGPPSHARAGSQTGLVTRECKYPFTWHEAPARGPGHIYNHPVTARLIKDTLFGGSVSTLLRKTDPISFKPTVKLIVRQEPSSSGGIFKKCVNSQAVYPLSEQHGLEAQERR